MVFENALSTFSKNIGILLVFSVSFLLGLFIPILASTPTYNAMGAVFLRFMSIPEMSWLDAVIIAVAFLLSNYFVAFGIVAVNLIVKRERTAINLTNEIISNISKNTFTIFMIFVFLFLVNAAVQLVLMELQAPYWLSAIIFFLIYLPAFYVGPAIVIDELKPFHAIKASIEHIKAQPGRVVRWVIAGLALLFITTYATYFIIPGFFQWVTLAINSFFIIPFLIVYQAHNYIEKYGILVTRGKRRSERIIRVK